MTVATNQELVAHRNSGCSRYQSERREGKRRLSTAWRRANQMLWPSPGSASPRMCLSIAGFSLYAIIDGQPLSPPQAATAPKLRKITPPRRHALHWLRRRCSDCIQALQALRAPLVLARRSVHAQRVRESSGHFCRRARGICSVSDEARCFAIGAFLRLKTSVFLQHSGVGLKISKLNKARSAVLSFRDFSR